MSFDERGRLAAHVFLDLASIYENDNVDAVAAAAASNLALERFNDIDVVRMEDGQLNLTDLLGAASTTITRLCQVAADARGVTVQEIVAEMREYWDAEF